MASESEVTFPYEVVKHLVQETTTQKLYNTYNTPLRNLNKRGEFFQMLAEKCSDSLGWVKCTPTELDLNINGDRRGSNSASYDYLVRINDTLQRVEVKSAQLKYDDTKKRWRVQFKGIKEEHFDRLIVVVYSPESVCLYHFKKDEDLPHLMTTGVSTSSKGKCIEYGGKKNETWRTALETIKTKWARSKLQELTYDHDYFTGNVIGEYVSLTEQVYRNVPLSSFSPTTRGKTFENIARWQDMMNPDNAVYDTGEALAACNYKRGKQQKEYDYEFHKLEHPEQDEVGGLVVYRTEVKSSQLAFDKAKTAWYIRADAIKTQFFDRLVLVVYTPQCFRAYETGVCNLKPYLSSAGKSTSSEGQRLGIYSSGDNWLAAATHIDQTLRERKFVPLFKCEFNPRCAIFFLFGEAGCPRNCKTNRLIHYRSTLPPVNALSINMVNTTSQAQGAPASHVCQAQSQEDRGASRRPCVNLLELLRKELAPKRFQLVMPIIEAEQIEFEDLLDDINLGVKQFKDIGIAAGPATAVKRAAQKAAKRRADDTLSSNSPAHKRHAPSI